MSGQGGAATWSCPSCERRVPSRQDLCHCGFDRRRRPPPRPPLGRPGAPGGAFVGRLLGGFAAAGVGTLLYFAFALWQESRAMPRPGVAELPSPRSPAPVAAALPVTTEPVEQVSPPASGAEVLRRQAALLLEPLLRPIARAADGLDLKFRYYLETCRADFRGAPPAGGRYWFVVWVSKAEIEWRDDQVEPGGVGQADAPDCRGTWIDVFEGARSIADALERFEETAQAQGVARDHVEEVLAAHRLTGWRETLARRKGKAPGGS